MDQGYEIRPAKELLDLIKNENGNFLYQNEDDMSKVFLINDQRIVWFPGIGRKGILFQNENVMKAVLENGVPIEEDSFNPFKANQEHLLHLNQHANYWLQVLSEKLGIDINVENDDIKYYKEISKNVNRFDPDKRYEELFIPLGIFVGEKMKLGTDAQWQLRKEYGYKPYHTPTLMESNDRELNPWYKLFDHLVDKKKFNFETFWKFVDHFGRFGPTTN